MDNGVERIRSQERKEEFAEIYVGTILFRGENVSMFGSMISPTLPEYLSSIVHIGEQPTPEQETQMRLSADAQIPYRVSLRRVFSAKQDVKAKRERAEEIWREYSHRLDNLQEGETLRDSFFRESRRRRDLDEEDIERMFKQYVEIGANAFEVVKGKRAEMLVFADD